MIALTIDCEQWNCPQLEGRDVPENGDTSFSFEGNRQLLKLLKKYNLKATFFITGYFAEKEPKQVLEIQEEGHEIACHGYNHFYRGNKKLNLEKDIIKAKEVIEKITKEKLLGFRSPQVQYSSKLLGILEGLGFFYDSSLHPAFLPGYYNFSDQPQNIFKQNNIWEIPIAVGNYRLPISWLFTRVFGINRTISSCRRLIKKNIAPVVYYHSWEFIEMKSKNVPFYYNFKTGKPLLKDLERLINSIKPENFQTIKDLLVL